MKERRSAYAGYVHNWGGTMLNKEGFAKGNPKRAVFLDVEMKIGQRNVAKANDRAFVRLVRG